jgi:uncharacterized protein YndB with AHSA1/START domain
MAIVTTMNAKAQVTLPSDSEVEVTRDFRAPRTLVWQAHTEPKLMQRWLVGYPGWTMPVCEMDVRPGGKYRWRWRSDEGGNEFGFVGEFKEVDQPVLLSHHQYYDPGDSDFAMPTDNPCKIRNSFIETDGITTLTTRMDFGTKEARDAAVSTGMTDGMEVNYELLDRMFAEQRGN